MEPENTCSKAGRPREFCTEMALDHAIEVFWRKGYDGTSLSDLTEAMGINRPSLYAAYGNKEGLFRRALVRYAEKAKSVFSAADCQPTARGFIEHLLKSGIRKTQASGEPAGCFVLQGASNHCGMNDEIGRDVAKFRAEPRLAIECRLRRAVDAGELPAGTDVVTLARFYATVMNGLSVQAVGGADPEALATVVEMAMRVWPEE